jgi:hypothetical protein
MEMEMDEMFYLKLLLFCHGIILPLVIWHISFKRNNTSFLDSIDSAIEERKNIDANWEEFYQFFLRKGFKHEEIRTVVQAIQTCSQVAQIMILPQDDLYADLKVDATDEDDDKMAHQITQKLDLQSYEDGELIDKDVSTVIELFDFINSKRQQRINKNLFLSN